MKEKIAKMTLKVRGIRRIDRMQPTKALMKETKNMKENL